MTVESKINFQRGQKVKVNPTNPGKPKRNGEQRSLNRIGIVKKVITELEANTNGEPVYKPTGEILVIWKFNKTETSEQYSHLKIIQ